MLSNEESVELLQSPNRQEGSNSSKSGESDELSQVSVDMSSMGIYNDDYGADPSDHAEQNPKADQLFEAFKENNVNEIRRLLEQENISIATRFGPDEFNMVHLAALHNCSKDVFGYLLNNGATANHVDREGRLPLHWAVAMGHKDSVSILVRQCPQLVNQPVMKPKRHGTPEGVSYMPCPSKDMSMEIPRFARGLSPLHLASQRADIECVRRLLLARADCNALDVDKLTPLDKAGEELPNDKHESASFLQVIKALVAKGGKPTTDPDARYQKTPLHTAVGLGCADAISVLKEAGYTKLVPDHTGNSPLHLAARQRPQDPDNCPLTELVSAYGQSELESRNKAGERPLHLVVQQQWLQGVVTLLDNGADITTVTVKNKTVLHLAASNHVIMNELLGRPNSRQLVNMKDKEGNTPLFCSIFAKNYKCVVALLDHKADITELDGKKRTVLHCAVQMKHTGILEALFKHDEVAMKAMIDETTQDNEGLTALHITAKQNYSKGVDILVRYGCDLKKRTKKGLTALECEKGLTALEWATIKGYNEVVRTLLKKGRSLVHVSDEKGIMPIHRACINRDGKIASLLIDAGSDLSATCTFHDNHQTTAMDLLIHRVPSSVELLDKCMDACFMAKKTLISIDYKVLLPNSHSQMKVLNALVQTGDKVNQRSLFMHPLVESFLYLQWKTISKQYTFLIVAYMVLVISFSMLVVDIFSAKEKESSDDSLSVFNIVLRVLLVLSSIVHVPHEAMLMTYKHRNSTLPWKFSTLRKKRQIILGTCLRTVNIVFKTVIILVTVMDPVARDLFPRELTLAAIILFWVQFMWLVSRVPTYGFYMLMFFEVTANFFKVLLSFTFLIVAFMIIFFVEFQAKPPFHTRSETLIKTIIMMTNEFEYADMFKDFEGDTRAWIFAKVVFLAFVFLVGIVIMNILLAKAILDMKKVDRLRNQAEFLSAYKHFLGWRKFAWFKSTNVERELKIKADSQDSLFPQKLMHTILKKAYAIKKQYKENQMNNNLRKDSQCNGAVETQSSDKLSSHHNSNNYATLEEINKKLDLLTRKIDQLSKMPR